VKRSIFQLAIGLAGLFVFVACLAYVSASEAAASQGPKVTSGQAQPAVSRGSGGANDLWNVEQHLNGHSAQSADANITTDLLTQPLAQVPSEVSLMRPPTRTRTPTRTATRTPTRTPTTMNTPTNTPIPSCGLAWRNVSSPGPATALYGIEVVSANDIWAVGIDYTTNPARMLIEHWDGTQWSIVPSPNVGTDVAYLFKVSAVSANDIWAIGTRNNRTLAIHWNGIQWSIAATPNPGTNENYVLDVEAVSAKDVWAVGYFRSGPPYVPMAMHWDGTSWSVVPSPNPGTYASVLASVDAISANDIWAVGYTFATNGSQAQTLTMHWNGSSWGVVPSGSFNQLSSVSAVSSNDVWAVGSTGLYQITMHWNGSNWSEVPSPEPANDFIYLNDVVAISSNDAWAVGYYLALEFNDYVPWILHWDGTQWSEVPSPDLGTRPNFLYAVAAASATDVWAVGYNYNGPLILHYSDPCASKSTSTLSNTYVGSVHSADER
jgi:hypothetical protein